MTPQQRADRIRIFRKELAESERAGAIELTAEQRSSIDRYVARALGELASRHDVDTTEPEKKISLGMRIVSALGGIALCIALVLFLERYLGLWSTPLQLGVLLGLPLLFAFAADFAAKKEKTLYYAALLSLVAFAAFVANLWVLGVLFNLSPTPNAFAAWSIFGLALAYHLGTRFVLAAGLVSLLGWITASTNLLRGWWWLDFGKRPEELLLGGLAIAAAGIFLRHRRHADFPAVYRLVGMLAFFLAQLYLSFAGEASYLPMEHKTIEHFYQVFGVLTAGLTIWAGIRNGWTGMINLGTAFFTIFLFFRLIDWWWDWMPKYIFFLLIGLVALALVAAFKRIRSLGRATA